MFPLQGSKQYELQLLSEFQCSAYMYGFHCPCFSGIRFWHPALKEEDREITARYLLFIPQKGGSYPCINRESNKREQQYGVSHSTRLDGDPCFYLSTPLFFLSVPLYSIKKMNMVYYTELDTEPGACVCTGNAATSYIKERQKKNKKCGIFLHLAVTCCDLYWQDMLVSRAEAMLAKQTGGFCIFKRFFGSALFLGPSNASTKDCPKTMSFNRNKRPLFCCLGPDTKSHNSSA